MVSSRCDAEDVQEHKQQADQTRSSLSKHGLSNKAQLSGDPETRGGEARAQRLEANCAVW